MPANKTVKDTILLKIKLNNLCVNIYFREKFTIGKFIFEGSESLNGFLKDRSIGKINILFRMTA
jgi:hypothetical protein